MASPATLTTDRSMIVEAHLSENEASELYIAAQRLRARFSADWRTQSMTLIKDDILKLCDFIQENI